jgi:hypothetical protein
MAIMVQIVELALFVARNKDISPRYEGWANANNIQSVLRMDCRGTAAITVTFEFGTTLKAQPRVQIFLCVVTWTSNSSGSEMNPLLRTAVRLTFL